MTLSRPNETLRLYELLLAAKIEFSIRCYLARFEWRVGLTDCVLARVSKSRLLLFISLCVIYCAVLDHLLMDYLAEQMYLDVLRRINI